MCQNKPKEAKCMPKQSQNDLLSKLVWLLSPVCLSRWTVFTSDATWPASSLIAVLFSSIF